MNRRQLFKFIGAATAVSLGGLSLIDTRKTFFLPPAGGWRMSDMHLSLDEFERRIIAPMAQSLAHAFDKQMWVFSEKTTEVWYQCPDVIHEQSAWF